MNINRIIYTTLLLVFVFCANLTAQETEEANKHELSIWAAGGLSSLKYSPKIGSHKHGLGGQFGLGYTYFFSKNWGLGTGAELSLHQAKTTLNGLTGNYDTQDYEGADFNFRYAMNKYEDKQTALFVNIPLMLQFQTTGQNKFFAALGGKIGLPINEKTQVNKFDLQTSGYFADENWEYTDEEYMGFGHFSGKGKKEDLDFKISYMLSAEAGMKWAVGEKNSLYTGAYIDYGLNDINKTKVTNDKLLAYNTLNPKDLEPKSIMYTQYSDQGSMRSITKKVNQLAVGVKVRFAFGMGSTKKAPKVVEMVEIEPALPPVVETVKDDKKEEQLVAEKERQKQQELELARKKEKELAELKEREIRKDKETLEIDITGGFDINKVALTTEMKRQIDDKISILKKHADWNIICIGHTCDLGSSAINKRFGQERAASMKDYLVGKGIDKNRISVESKGETEPHVSNTSEENRRQNRRIQIKLVD